jgi:2-hydroxy-4-carboxymuconate semialdehyde hemiacetal dehydrogenase
MRTPTFFRHIGDTGTYIARYDELVNAKGGEDRRVQVDVPMNGIELQDREFFAAIRERRTGAAAIRCCTTGAAVRGQIRTGAEIR